VLNEGMPNINWDSGIAQSLKALDLQRVQIQDTAGTRCEYEFLTFVLAPNNPTSLRLRRSVK